MSNPENDLDRALRHQVEHLNEAPLTLGDVQQRARRIQRHRRIAASVAAAAAVAIIAPIGLLITDDDPRTLPPSKEPTTTTTGPSPTESSTQTFQIDLTPPAEGTTGGEPGIPYWFNGQLTSVDGHVVPIASAVHNAIQDPTNGQWAGVVQDDQANYAWTSFDDSGADLQSFPALSDSVAVTPDGASYAYLAHLAPEGAGEPTWQLVLGGDDARSWDLGSAAPPRPGTGPVGILSDGTVVYEFEAGKPMLARPDGSTEAVPGQYLKTVAASYATGRIAVETSYNDDGTSCWAVIDSTGAADAEQCDYALGDFSADGHYVIGYPSDSDGLGLTSVSILNSATLEPAATFTMPRNGFLATNLAWTGDKIVANAFFEGTWHVEFLGADGVLQLRSVAVSGDEFSPPFQFAAGPLNVTAP